MEPDAERGSIGRPLTFDRAVFDEICEQIASGMTLRQVCRQEGMPPESTVRRWVIANHEGVSAQYRRARELGFEAMAEETLDIVDDGSNDWMERIRRDGSKEVVLDREHVERSRLRVNQRNWLLGRLARNVYGERPPKEGDGDEAARDVVIRGGLPSDADN